MLHLFVTSNLDCASTASGIRYPIELCVELLRRGDQVVVATLPPLGDLSLLQPFLVNGRLKLRPLAHRPQARQHFRFYEDVASSAISILQELSPDVVHVHAWSGLLGAVRAIVQSRAIPVIYTAYTFDIICFRTHLNSGTLVPCSGPESAEKCRMCINRNSIRHHGGLLMHAAPTWLIELLRPTYPWKRIYRSAEAQLTHQLRLLASFDAIIAPSLIMKEKLTEYGADRSHTFHVPYAVSQSKIWSRQRNPSRELRVAFFGHAGWIKGLWVLGEALAQLPKDLPLRLLVFMGSTIDQIEKQWPVAARRFVEAFGEMRDQEVAAVYCDVDTIVVPSVWHENSPFVVLESLANATPVLASDHRGISEHVSDGWNGFLVPPGNPRAWVMLLDRLAQEPERVRSLRSNCRYTRTISDYVDDLMSVVAQVCESDNWQGGA